MSLSRSIDVLVHVVDVLVRLIDVLEHVVDVLVYVSDVLKQVNDVLVHLVDVLKQAGRLLVAVVLDPKHKGRAGWLALCGVNLVVREILLGVGLFENGAGSCECLANNLHLPPDPLQFLTDVGYEVLPAAQLLGPRVGLDDQRRGLPAKLAEEGFHFR